jgi:hypothetical protein
MGYEVIDRRGSEDDERVVVDKKIIANDDGVEEDENPQPEMGERGDEDKTPDLHDITIDQIDGTDLGIVPTIKPEIGEVGDQREIDRIRQTILEDGILDKVDYPNKYDVDAKNKN